MARKNCDKFHIWTLIVLSIAAFALGVANLTVQCSGGATCLSSDNTTLFDTASSVFMLAVGIWASIPCLSVGVGLLRQLKKPDHTKNWVWTKLVASTFFFSPALVIFSAFNTVQAGALMDSPATTSQTVAFAVPLSAAIVGGVIHIKLFISHIRQNRAMRKNKKAVAAAPAAVAVVPVAGPMVGAVGPALGQTGRPCTCGGAAIGQCSCAKPAGGCGCGAGGFKSTAWHSSSAGHSNCTCYSPYGGLPQYR